MGQLITHIAVFLCSAITAAIFMPWLLNLCHKFELTHESNDSHHFRIPRVGGMILAPAAAVGLAVSIGLRQYYGDVSDTFKSSSVFIGLGVLTIYLLGLVDDIFGLNKWQKRGIYLAASLAFPICGLYINDFYGMFGIYAIPSVAGIILTVIVTILITKGLNSINDSDGLSSCVCLVPFCVYLALYFNQDYFGYSTLATAMIGSILVFLYYNLFGDKRIGTKTYMGHAGGMIMSYCIVYLSLKYAVVNEAVMDRHADGLVLPYSMLIIPIYEYLRVVVTSNWLGLTKPERRALHIQHRLASKGFSQIQVMLIILAADIIFIGTNLCLHYFLHVGLMWIIIIDIVLYNVWITIYSHQQVKKKHTEHPLNESFPDYKGKTGLVSVIMPTWNSEKYVRGSIESVLSQTYSNLELIITDDCSTDSTMEILREYEAKDPRVKVLQNKENGGAGVSRNNSIIAAQGQYIAFCDSDDRWIADKLEKQIAFMRSKDVALCFSPYYSCDGRNQYLGYISAPRRVTLFQMMCDNKIGFLTAIYDTHQLGKHPMPKQRKRQDHALLLNLLKICRYAYSIPEPLAHYRIHPGNMSGKKLSLLKYNAHTYTAVFGWPKPLGYAFLFTFFLPTYFTKRAKNILLTMVRAASN